MKRLDGALIEKFREGDKAAFKEIHDHLYDGLLVFCSYLVPREEAKDITAETFFKLWKMRKQWENEENIRAFLYITARNNCFNFLNAQRTKNIKQQEIATDLISQQQLETQATIESEIIVRLSEAVENLPDYHRRILKLSYYDGFKNPEIARQLGISEKTVRNVKSLALRMIKAALFNKNAQLSFLLIFFLQTQPAWLCCIIAQF